MPVLVRVLEVVTVLLLERVGEPVTVLERVTDADAVLEGVTATVPVRVLETERETPTLI